MINKNKSESSIKQAQRKVNSSSHKKEQSFNKFMKDSFPSLQTEYPDIFLLLQLIQTFNFNPIEDHCLYKLNDSVNVSKHRHFTKNSLYQKGIIRNF